MKVGDAVRTAIALPGIPARATGTVGEVRRLFVLVCFEEGRKGYYARHQLSPVLECMDKTEDWRQGKAVPLGIADVRLPRGSHSCLLPSSEGAILSATSCFAAAGLRNGETVLCGVPSKRQSAFLCSLRRMGVARDRDSGRDRLVLTSPSRFYLPRPRFSGQRQLERTTAALVGASRENPNGARAFAHAGRRHSLAGWWEYEERLTPILAETGVTCLCVYDRTGWETESWRMAADLHPYVVRDGVVSRGGAPAA